MDFTSKIPTIDDKRSFVLEEKARALAAQSKFYEAATVLEEIETSDEIQELGMKLLMAECYMQLGRENKATKAMKSVRNIITKPPKPHVDAVMELADGYDGSSSYVRELFLFQLASEMYQESDITDSEKFDGVYRCLSESRNVAARMLKSTKAQKEKSGLDLKNLLAQLGNIADASGLKQAAKGLGISTSDTGGSQVRLHAIAMDFGIENMLEMFEYLRKANGVDPDRKAQKVANASNAIGYVYVLAQENEKSIRVRRIGVETMEKHFGPNACRYNHLGDLIHNIAVAMYNLDRYKEAETHYKRAIEIYEGATDYDGEKSRQKDIDKSKSDLRDTRQRLTS